MPADVMVARTVEIDGAEEATIGPQHTATKIIPDAQCRERWRQEVLCIFGNCSTAL
jgi:hypothetical protein